MDLVYSKFYGEQLVKRNVIGDEVGMLPITEAVRLRIEAVTERFPFRATSYYLSLVNWEDPDDPIRRIIVPNERELEGWEWGSMDPSDEHAYTVFPGCEHKYRDVVLLMVSDTCGGLCRYCFRKRLFVTRNDEKLRDVDRAVAYVRSHPEVRSVLLSGGDPLMLSTGQLEGLISRLHAIPHVESIRIGSKIPAYYPHRIVRDEQFIGLFETYSSPEKRLYLVSHFCHPRELTPIACEAMNRVHLAGGVVVNQTPLLRGVNDDPEVLGELFSALARVGIAPYYVFQGRLTTGNRAFAVPLEEGYTIFEQARARTSGLGKRARFVMSHAEGKIEVAGLTDRAVVLKMHRAADPARNGEVLLFARNPGAYWLEDYGVPLNRTRP